MNEAEVGGIMKQSVTKQRNMSGQKVDAIPNKPEMTCLTGNAKIDELLPNPPVPDILFHYCSATSLKGIIENREIWTGSACFLNDPLEWLWLPQIASRHLMEKHYADRWQGSRRIKSDYIRLYEFLQEPYHRIPERLGTFVASFTETADDLSQWRAYANDGQGFCIGFRPSSFNVPFQKVIYSLALQEQIVERTLEQIIGTPRRRKTAYAAEDCMSAFEKIQPLMKSRCYEQEAEWRIVMRREMVPSLSNGKMSHPESQDVRIRVSGESIVPYLAIRLSVNSIQRIIFGPRQPEPEASAYSIRMLLANNDFSNADIRIEVSSAPYRGK